MTAKGESFGLPFKLRCEDAAHPGHESTLQQCLALSLPH